MLNAKKSAGRYTFKLRGKVSHSMPPTLLPEEQKTLRGEVQKKSDTIINDMVYTMLKKVSKIVNVTPSYKFI